jgi:hypothetical protein
MTADEFFDTIFNTSAFFGGEGYWWEDLNDKRYLAERRQCIAFNLRRFDSVAESNKDYLSTIADSMEDAQQLWINKTSSGLDGPIGSEEGFGHNRGHSSTNRGHGTRSLAEIFVGVLKSLERIWLIPMEPFGCQNQNLPGI